MLSSSKIRHIVRLRHMLRKWRKKATAAARRTPSPVPSGHVAVCVGASSKRFVVRTTYLNHPAFEELLDQAQEEYGFVNSGPLAIPCDETFFEELIGYLGRSESGKSSRFTNFEDIKRQCRIGARSNLEFLPDSRPLLSGVSDKPVWVKSYIESAESPESGVLNSCEGV